MIFTNKTNKIITNKKQKTKLKYQDMYKLEPFAKRGKKVPNEFFVIPKFKSLFYHNFLLLRIGTSDLNAAHCLSQRKPVRFPGPPEVLPHSALT